MKRLALLFVFTACSLEMEPKGPPLANAGEDLEAAMGGSVALRGSGIDPEGAPLGFRWAVAMAPGGSAPTLSPIDQAGTELSAQAPGLYVLRLVTTNAAGVSSAPDYVNVRLRPEAAPAPRALVDPAGPFAPGQAARLVGRALGSEKGLAFAWAQETADSLKIPSLSIRADASGASATFTAPEPSDGDEELHLTLSAVDQLGLMGIARATVLVTRQPILKVAVACTAGCAAGGARAGTDLTFTATVSGGSASDFRWSVSPWPGEGSAAAGKLGPAKAGSSSVGFKLPALDAPAHFRVAVRAAGSGVGQGFLDLLVSP